MKRILLWVLLLTPLTLAAQQRDTTWRIQVNQRTQLTRDNAESASTPVEIKKLKFKDEIKVIFHLSELMPKTQTLELRDAKKQVVWTKTYTKITESKPPLITGAMLIKTKKKIVGKLTLVIKSPDLMRERVLGELQIRAVEKKR